VRESPPLLAEIGQAAYVPEPAQHGGRFQRRDNRGVFGQSLQNRQIDGLRRGHQFAPEGGLSRSPISVASESNRGSASRQKGG
jgi:hypothetical protein